MRKIFSSEDKVKRFLVLLIFGFLTCLGAQNASAGLINGNFSSGFYGWTHSGDVILGSSSSLSLPGMSGTYALFGSNSSAGIDVLSQTFSVKPGWVTISFDYYFAGKDKDPILDDWFIAIYDSNARTLLDGIHLGALSTSWGTTVVYGHYSHTFFGTSLQSITFSLIETAGICGDRTNSYGAIDNVSVMSKQCVPEPSVLLLIGCGLLGLGVYNSRSKRV